MEIILSQHGQKQKKIFITNTEKTKNMKPLYLNHPIISCIAPKFLFPL